MELGIADVALVIQGNGDFTVSLDARDRLDDQLFSHGETSVAFRRRTGIYHSNQGSGRQAALEA
jgi:hypothetical protein